MKSYKKPTDALVERTLNSLKRELERNYFYSKLENPHWVTPLREHGVFASPPKIIRVRENGELWPLWPALAYLVRVAPEVPREAVEIARDLPKTENPRVHHQIMELALAIKDVRLSTELLDKIIEAADAPRHTLGSDFSRILAFWATDRLAGVPAAVRLAPHLLEFAPDPRANEKKKERKEDPKSFFTRLEPVPKFDSWVFLKLLNEGVRPLAAVAPLECVRMLIDAISRLISLRQMEEEDEISFRDEDLSSIWCRRVDSGVGPHLGADEALVHTLTFALQRLSSTGGKEEILQAFSMLREARWAIFKRIGHYLAASQPSIALSWIHEAVMTFKDYSDSNYSHEFALMVRTAGNENLIGIASEEEFRNIFEAILRGPSEQRFRDFMGEGYTDELFQQRKLRFHRIQLWPFEHFLFGTYKDYFESLRDQGAEPTLQSYGPSVVSGEAKFVQTESPISKEELSRKSDADLVSYLNQWNDPHRRPEMWWVEINHRGLGDAFQSLILESPERFANWDREWEEIRRPVILRAAIDAATKFVEQRNLSHLETWFRLADVIVSRNNVPTVLIAELSSEADDRPDWDWTRRGVDSFLQACLKRETAIPLLWRERVSRLLHNLATSYDSILDQHREVFIGSNDPIGTAINTTRGQALERITDFGDWIGLQASSGGFSEAPEISRILKERFEGHPLLMIPEYAVLGDSFNRFFFWDSEWAIANLRSIFIHDDDLERWKAAFGTYLRFSRAYVNAYPTLEKDYRLAIGRVDIFQDDEDKHFPCEVALGLHLFTFYLNGIIPADAEDSLLINYYTAVAPKERAMVLHHIGASLTASPELPGEFLGRCYKFFEWRLREVTGSTAADAKEEFSHFESWTKATILDANWRLECIEKVLLLGGPTPSDYALTNALKEFLKINLSLAVKCFLLLVSNNVTKPYFYVDNDDAILILEAGLASGDSETRLNAQKAQDALLRAGRFEFLTLGSPRAISLTEDASELTE